MNVHGVRLADLEVIAKQLDSPDVTVRTNRAGVFRIEGLRPGRCRLILWAWDYEGTLDVTVGAQETAKLVAEVARVAEPALESTKSDFDRLPEDFRVELIDGAFLKMSSPTVHHQLIVGRLYVRLLEVVGEGRALLGTVGFVVDDLIDPVERTIEIRTPARKRVVQGQESAVSEAIAGFALKPAAIF